MPGNNGKITEELIWHIATNTIIGSPIHTDKYSIIDTWLLYAY